MLQPHILIVGAGVIGLTLAQALKKSSIPFTIFERDPTPSHRGKGWGLTIHWGLDTFLSLLPKDIINRLDETLVDPDAVARGENGKFLLFDLATGEAKWQVTAARRMRLSRERWRTLLMEGIDVQWSKKLESVKIEEDDVAVTFADGSTYTGTHLAGCDGSQSVVRRLICPNDFASQPLPVVSSGVSVPYSKDFIKPVRDLDPYFFMGTDPRTDAFLYFSFLDTPTNNHRTGALKDTYECQMMVSWPHRGGFLGRKLPVDMPEENGERLQLLKEISRDWAEPFRTAIQAIPENTRAQQVRVEDWIPSKDGWDNYGGRVIMLGDSAHPMTMYRGEAGNHGIADVKTYLDLYLPLWRNASSTRSDFQAAGDAYETEMLPRATTAVLNSRQACLDAHESKRIDDKSPLVLRKPVNISQ